MSALARDQNPSATSRAEPRLHRVTVDEMYRLAGVGETCDRAPFELIDGVIYEMAPQSSHHAAVVSLLQRWAMTSIMGGCCVRSQSPLRLSETSEPEPDLAICHGREEDYAERHPSAGDVHLVVEIAVTSSRFDLGEKALLYAAHGVPEYWVLDLERRVLVRHRAPRPEGYGEVVVFDEGTADLAPVAFPQATLTVRSVLPPPGSVGKTDV